VKAFGSENEGTSVPRLENSTQVFRRLNFGLTIVQGRIWKETVQSHNKIVRFLSSMCNILEPSTMVPSTVVQ